MHEHQGLLYGIIAAWCLIDKVRMPPDEEVAKIAGVLVDKLCQGQEQPPSFQAWCAFQGMEQEIPCLTFGRTSSSQVVVFELARREAFLVAGTVRPNSEAFLGWQLCRASVFCKFPPPVRTLHLEL